MIFAVKDCQGLSKSLSEWKGLWNESFLTTETAGNTSSKNFSSVPFFPHINNYFDYAVGITSLSP